MSWILRYMIAEVEQSRVGDVDELEQDVLELDFEMLMSLVWRNLKVGPKLHVSNMLFYISYLRVLLLGSLRVWCLRWDFKVGKVDFWYV